MIAAGERVILFGKGKTYLVHAGEGSLGTDLGMVDLSVLTGKEPGDILTTKAGKELTIRLPRATDFFEQAKRSGAPMLPRDIGLVIGLCGMNKQDHVLDAGTGSGVAAVFFAGVAGKVTTCERREEFFRLAQENIRETGLSNIEVLNRDVLEIVFVWVVLQLQIFIECLTVFLLEHLGVFAGQLFRLFVLTVFGDLVDKEQGEGFDALVKIFLFLLQMSANRFANLNAAQRVFVNVAGGFAGAQLCTV